MSLRVVPMRHAEANEFVRRLHRHNGPTLGAIFCVGVADEIVRGVAIVGRPVARLQDDGQTVEILRVCTDGARNACSMLYAACRRIAVAMGYARILTYTLPDEGGASLRAAGFVFDGDAGQASRNWHSRPGRTAAPIGDDIVGGKWRWVAALAASVAVVGCQLCPPAPPPVVLAGKCIPASKLPPKPATHNKASGDPGAKVAGLGADDIAQADYAAQLEAAIEECVDKEK